MQTHPALHTILLGVGGMMHVPRTLEPLEQLGINDHRAKRLALKLHVHSVQKAYKLASTRRALKQTYTNSYNGLNQGAASHIPTRIDLTPFPLRSGGESRCFGPRSLLSLS